MITQLKKRDRLDTLKNDVRAGGIAWGRYIYLVLLAALFLYILNFFFGHYIFLNANGLVIRNTHTVAPLYTIRVKKVHVRRGDQVHPGQPLLEIESAILMQQLAQLSTEVADLTSKTAQIKARTQIARVLLPTAREYAEQTTQSLEKLQNINNRALVTAKRFEQAMKDKIEANARLSELEAESSVFTKELHYIETAQNDAKEALKNLKSLYNQGKINAPVKGIIGTGLASEGDVIPAGKPLMHIHTGTPYIAAFLPEDYSFALRPGQKVRIKSGPLKTIGKIEKLLPVAAALPKEFQSGIKPTGRQRLIRITLPEDHPFVISQKITVKGCWTETCHIDWSGYLVSFRLRAKEAAILTIQSLHSVLTQMRFLSTVTIQPETTTALSLRGSFTN